MYVCIYIEGHPNLDPNRASRVTPHRSFLQANPNSGPSSLFDPSRLASFRRVNSSFL